jgi:GntR family transcriptional regulator, transcriptional repressor for pyruvate dehydrogenase complex
MIAFCSDKHFQRESGRTYIGKEKTMTSNTTAAEATYRPAYETAAVKIAALIVSTGLQAGDRLPTEQELGERLGVSRTVVREAVKALVATGQVYARKGSGLYVAARPSPFALTALDPVMPVDPAHVISLYEFRLTLEVQTARWAAERSTPLELRMLREALALNQHGAEADQRQQFREGDIALHQGIAEASHNPFLASTVASITRVQDWVFEIAAGRTHESLMTVVEQHTAVVTAIQEGQPDAAAHTMQAHLEWALASYQQEVRLRLGVEASE